MTDEDTNLVRKYLSEITAQWRTEQATEHSYRLALKSLLEALLRNVIVINEPTHIQCGAPDYILREKRSALNLGFIEAKDIGDGDLDGNGVHKEQFNRYKNSLENLCFTDYLDFHFYKNGEFKDKVRIAEICGDKLVPAAESVIEKFVGMIEHFGAAKAQTISSPVRLAKLMAGKARLLAQAIKEFLLQDTDKTSMLAGQMAAFRQVLIHDISEESFADVYAQTITYGMFAARLHDNTPEDFTRAEAANLIPKTNPLLRQMFNYIAADTNDTVEWIVDDLITLFAATDLRQIMKDYGKSTEQTDPILHFYEDFLAAYNPDLRKARGVWNTPRLIVCFVDMILETEFGLQGGLANNSKASSGLSTTTRRRSPTSRSSSVKCTGSGADSRSRNRHGDVSRGHRTATHRHSYSQSRSDEEYAVQSLRAISNRRIKPRGRFAFRDGQSVHQRHTVFRQCAGDSVELLHRRLPTRTEVAQRSQGPHTLRLRRPALPVYHHRAPRNLTPHVRLERDVCRVDVGRNISK